MVYWSMCWPGVRIVSRRCRDLFRKRYWVKCWFCDYSAGPFKTEAEQKQHLMHRCSEGRIQP